MSAVLKPEDDSVIQESLVIHQGNTAVRQRGMPFNIILRRVLKTKTEATPLPTFFFYGESDGVECKVMDNGERVDLVFHLKKAAP